MPGPAPPLSGVVRLRLFAELLATRGAASLMLRLWHQLRLLLPRPPVPTCPSGPFLSTPPAAHTSRPNTDALAAMIPPKLRGRRADAATPSARVRLRDHGDVRLLWQGARFADIATLTRAGQTEAAEALIAWFLACCPPGHGAHWASAQEAAYRLLHLADATLPGPASTGMRALVALHAKRIQQSLGYELSQRNNHGIVCLVALMAAQRIAGQPETLAPRLDRHITGMVTQGGTFRQVSSRYQALVVSVLGWARAAGLPLGPKALAASQRAEAWLRRIGADAGLGHDDASLVLGGTAPALPTDGAWIDAAGGVAALSRDGVRLVLRLPGGVFPAGQADALALILADADGQVLIRDAGTWLYAPPPGTQDLSAARHHSSLSARTTRLSRFLYARAPASLVALSQGWVVAVSGPVAREVSLSRGRLSVTDRATCDAMARFRIAGGPATGWHAPRYGLRQRIPVRNITLSLRNPFHRCDFTLP